MPTCNEFKCLPKDVQINFLQQSQSMNVVSFLKQENNVATLASPAIPITPATPIIPATPQYSAGTQACVRQCNMRYSQPNTCMADCTAKQSMFDNSTSVFNNMCQKQ